MLRGSSAWQRACSLNIVGVDQKRATALALMVVVACAGPSEQGKISASPFPATGAPSVAHSATPSPAPSATPSAAPTTVAFPDVPIIIGTSEGELRRANGPGWDLVAKPCPSASPGTNAISALRLTADGLTALIQCAAAAGAGGDPGAGTVLLVDTTTGRVSPGPALDGGARIGPVSPDGRSVVVSERGDCPMPAPVCQTRSSLVDLRSGAKRELLASGYYLGLEMRWSSAGLTYFQPQCASAGCSGLDGRGGSYLWDGRGWSKISEDRLIDATATRALYERRHSLTAGPDGTKVVERTGGVDRVLTPAGVDTEVALALVDDRIYVWRPGRTIYEGTLVVYEGGRVARETPGRFSGENVHRWGDWLIATELSGAPSWALLAYSMTRDRFASRFANLWISGLAVPPGN